MNVTKKFNELIMFAMAHGGSLKNHIRFGDEVSAVRKEIAELEITNVFNATLVNAVNDVLENFTKAYAIDLFPENSKEEREGIQPIAAEEMGRFVSRQSASMGRHMVKVIRQHMDEAVNQFVKGENNE
jgi:Pyruvate/2-oxoacid:ferredoxin oxidoreductase gamma subunit